MSMKNEYDFVVIGGGSGGYAGARTAVELGLHTAVIDSAHILGGLCILRGCMPSKTLIESANRNLTLRRASEFGLRASGLEVHPKEIRDRKRKLIGEFAEYRQGQLTDGRFDLLRGRAEFVDDKRIRIHPNDGGEPTEITAATTLIATGSKISPPPIPDLRDVGYLTSDDILDADDYPESVIVLGGGAIAVEMAHFLDGVGSEVTIIQRSPQILRSMDEDAARALEGALRERGLTLYTGTSIEGAERTEGGKSITFTHDGSTKQVEAAEILYALGRSPNSDSLNLGAAGVESDRAGRVIANNQQATSQAHIFAAGDVCGPLEVVHIAIEQGEAAATNAAIALGKLKRPPREISYRLKLFGVFTEPQVAAVGLNEREAEEAGIAFKTASYPFDDHGKSMTKGETHGFVKLIVDENGTIIGASCVGPEAAELIHEVVVAMHFNAKASELAGIPHYHPTLSEIWTYPADELSDISDD